MSRPSPADVAADKAAIDADIRRLLAAVGVTAALPPADPDPDVGPWAHLQRIWRALGDVPQPTAEAFRASWLSALWAFEVSHTARTAEVAVTDFLRAATMLGSGDRAIVKAGRLWPMQPRDGEVLLLSPLAPPTAIYAARANRVRLLAATVRAFVSREVDHVLAELAGPAKRSRAVGAAPDRATATAPAAPGDKQLAALRKRQVRADRVEVALVYGQTIADLASTAELVMVDAAVRAAGLTMLFCNGDAENADEAYLCTKWIAGVILHAASGGPEQRTGFELPAAELAAAKAQVAAALRASAIPAGRLADDLGVHLVARGGSCTGSLARGQWLTPPKSALRDPIAVQTWLAERSTRSAAGTAAIGYVQGTKAATQAPYPAVIHGCLVASASSTAEPVDLSAARVRDVDRALAAAKIVSPRYYLMTRFD